MSNMKERMWVLAIVCGLTVSMNSAVLVNAEEAEFEEIIVEELTVGNEGTADHVSVAEIVEITETPLHMKMTWDRNKDGVDVDIQAILTGTLDDGGMVERAQTEGEYFSSLDDSWIGSHYIYGDEYTELSFNRLDGIYDINIEWGNLEPIDYGWSYGDVDLNLQFYTENQEYLNIAADYEKGVAEGRECVVPIDEYLQRGVTGVWYLAFRLDHGKIVPVTGMDEGYDMSEWGSESPDYTGDMAEGDSVTAEGNTREVWISQDGDKNIEEYTPDGKIQFREAYNKDGYKLGYSWYDNEECTAFTRWTYVEENRLDTITHKTVMDTEAFQVCFKYEDDVVKMYNHMGTYLSEGASALEAAEKMGIGYLVQECLPQE